MEAIGSEFACLLCRGGSGEEDQYFRSVDFWGNLLTASFGAHQWRRQCAVVIFGRWGRSELWCIFRHGVINLQAGMPIRRPSSSSTATFNVVWSPSGSVPGDDTDGRRVELFISVGGEGPDRDLDSLVKVLFVKAKGLFLIFFYSVVLDVNCYPTD